jgi:esterase
MICHFKEQGKGKPLVFLHGLFGSGDNLGPIARGLGGYHCTLIDLPNHGQSPKLQAISIPTLAQVVLNTLDHLGLQHPTLIGHSLGGKIAMELALEYPERTGALVVMDIGPLGSSPRYRNFLEAMMDLPLQNFSDRQEALEALAKDIPDPLLRGFFGKSLTRAQGELSWRFGLEGIEAGFEEIWQSLEGDREYLGPTLFLGGEKSDYLSPPQLAAMEEMFPAHKREIIPGAGHWLHADQPKAVISALEKFLGVFAQ